MRVERQIMDNSAHNRITWDDADWDLVAAELKRQYPTRKTEKFYSFEFSTLEIEDAAEQVIQQDRQRSFSEFEPVKRALWNAFERMKPNAKGVVQISSAKTKHDQHIVWVPEEWEAVIAELHTNHPTLFEKNCVHLNVKMMEDVQRIFPVARRRNFKQVVGLRVQLMKMWGQMQAAKRDAAPPVIVDFTSGPIMEPPTKKSDVSNALATAMHDAFKAGPTEQRLRRKRIDSTPQEWLLTAREMRRQNPHINFFASKFEVIDLAAIRDAQREVLPLERRRKLLGTRGLQEPLVTAFKALLEEVKQENAIATREPEQVEPEAVQISPEPEQVAVPASPIYFRNEGFPTGVTHADAQINTFNAAVLSAAAPLVNLMIDEMVKRLMPQLTDMLTGQISASIGGAVQKALEAFKPASVALSAAPWAPAPVTAQAVPQGLAQIAQQPPARPTAAQIAAFNNVTVEKTKKPKIALLGPTGRQKNDIEGTFPDYNFVFIENGHGIKEACVDCELFIVYTSHFNASNKAAVKKYLDHDKLRQVSGSMSAVKHQIHSWQAMNNAKKGN
jgi:hypothetical protein